MAKHKKCPTCKRSQSPKNERCKFCHRPMGGYMIVRSVPVSMNEAVGNITSMSIGSLDAYSSRVLFIAI